MPPSMAFSKFCFPAGDIGGLHWVVQLLHLLVGLGAIGQAENLTRRLLTARTRQPASQPAAA